VFDIAFSELVVIAIVALIVIGPEKLPKVARTLGALAGRMQRYMAQIKEEVNREDRFAELQKLQEEIKAAANSAQTGLQAKANEIVQDPIVQSSSVVDDAKTGADAGKPARTPKSKE